MTQYPIAEVRERLNDLAENEMLYGVTGSAWPPVAADLTALLTHLDAVEGENARLRAEVNEAQEQIGVLTADTHHWKANYDGLLSLVTINEGQHAKYRNAAETAELQRDEALAQLASQAASLAEMREALEPFAAIFWLDDGQGPMPGNDTTVCADDFDNHLTFGMVRHARAALSSPAAKPQPDAAQALQNKAES